MTLILRADQPMTNPGAAPFRLRPLPVGGDVARWSAVTVPLEEVYAKTWESSTPGGPTLAYTPGSINAPVMRREGAFPYLEFNGVVQGLTAPLVLPQPHSIVMVVRTHVLDSSAIQVLSGDQNVPGGDAIDRANIFAAGGVGTRTIRMTAGANPSSTIAPTDQWAVLVAVFDTDASVMRLDDAEQTGISAGTARREGISFGHYRAGMNFAPMDLAEAVVYPFALDAAQRADTVAGLRAAYGV